MRQTFLLVLLVLFVPSALPFAAPADDARVPGPPPHAMAPMSQPGSDSRTPLPLLPMMAEHQKRNMRDHLAAVQEMVAALAADDLVAVAKAARRIGYSDKMAQMCRHMGAGAQGFSGLALSFHRTADTIAEAADRGDRKAATAALGATLQTCVSCHATYRQEVVDPATWERITNAPDHP